MGRWGWATAFQASSFCCELSADFRIFGAGLPEAPSTDPLSYVSHLRWQDKLAAPGSVPLCEQCRGQMRLKSSFVGKLSAILQRLFILLWVNYVQYILSYDLCHRGAVSLTLDLFVNIHDILPHQRLFREAQPWLPPNTKVFNSREKNSQRLLS